VDEQRVREITREEIAAAGTTAVLEEQLQLIEIRKQRIERRVTDPEARQQLLAALEAQCCLLQSSLRLHE